MIIYAFQQSNAAPRHATFKWHRTSSKLLCSSIVAVLSIASGAALSQAQTVDSETLPSDTAATTPASQPTVTNVAEESAPSTQPPAVAPDELLPVARVTSVAADGSEVSLNMLGTVPPVGSRCILVAADATPVAVARLLSSMTSSRGAASPELGDSPSSHRAAIIWRDPATREDDEPLRRATVLCVPTDAARRMRSNLPYRAALWARVRSVGESGRTAWLAHGLRDGLRENDELLAEHDGWPVARLGVVSLSDGFALTSVTALAADVSVQGGDWARVWRASDGRDVDYTGSRVLRVQSSGASQRVWVPYASPAVADVGDRWYFLHDDAYAALGEVVEVTERFVIIETRPSFSRSAVQHGDEAVRRSRVELAGGRHPLHLFRIESDYCLVSAGERDGIRTGMTLSLIREGRIAGHLRVTTPHEDHCGAELITPTDQMDTPLNRWDEVRMHPAYATRRPCGAVASTIASVGLITARNLATDAPPLTGDVVMIHSRGHDLAAIIVTSSADTLLLTTIIDSVPPWVRSGDTVLYESTE